MFRNVLLALALATTYLLLTAATNLAQNEETFSKEKTRLALEYIEVSGAEKLGIFMCQTAAHNTTVAILNARHETWSKNFTKEDIKVFTDAWATTLWNDLREPLLLGMADIQIKYFSESEIKQLIKFYNSETGKKLANLSLKVSQEGSTLGQRIGKEWLNKFQNDPIYKKTFLGKVQNDLPAWAKTKFAPLFQNN